jgi:integrase
MLKDNVPLPIISEAMGHSDTQVTTVYTSIDINSLRKCALPMPEVTSEIYCKGDYSDDSKD